MTELLERAVEAARNLPPEMQDEIARLVLQLASDESQPAIELTQMESASFDESFRQEAEGDFATDDKMRAIWAKHGL